MRLWLALISVAAFFVTLAKAWSGRLPDDHRSVVPRRCSALPVGAGGGASAARLAAALVRRLHRLPAIDPKQTLGISSTGFG